jgi:multiple sugar transport system ATP-binding protein
MDPKGHVVGKVTLVERLGTETIVELVSMQGTAFRFASGDVSDLNVGEEVRFSFDASLAHLF